MLFAAAATADSPSSVADGSDGLGPFVSCSVIAIFHYTGPTGPDRTRTDFFLRPGSPRNSVWARAGLRQSPCGSGRARVVDFSL